MIKNYEVIKRDNIYFGKGALFEKITIKCDKCKKEFTMGRIIYEDAHLIEYTYCPHCANRLEV